MTTVIDKETIHKAYEDVRNDNTDTVWMCVGDSDSKLTVTKTGTDFSEIESTLDEGQRAFYFVRLTVGDEMSRRAKFGLVTWIGGNCKPIQRGRVAAEKTALRDCIQNFAVDLTYSEPSEFTQEEVEEAMRKAGGANYGRG